MSLVTWEKNDWIQFEGKINNRYVKTTVNRYIVDERNCLIDYDVIIQPKKGKEYQKKIFPSLSDKRIQYMTMKDLELFAKKILMHEWIIQTDDEEIIDLNLTSYSGDNGEGHI